MENKEFDDIIKKKLESLSSEGTGDNWDVFRQRWQESNQDTDDSLISDGEPEPMQDAGLQAEKDLYKDDAEFDKKIKDNLLGFRVPFNSAHWVRLKSQLEAEAFFRKKLFLAKSVEVLMLLLIVVGILNIVPVKNETYQIPVYDTPMVVSVPVNKGTAAQYDADAISEYHRINQDPIVNAINTFIAGDRHEEVLADIKTNPSEVKTQKSPQQDQRPSIENNNLELLPFLSFPSRQQGTPKDDLRSRKLTAVALKHSIRQVSADEDQITMQPLAPNITPATREDKTFLSLAIGPKVNLVNSPFDPVYKVDPYNTLNTNFNIGAKIEREIGPLTAYAGLGYHQTSYEPLPISELYEDRFNEYNQTSLENISFSTIDIPVGVRYDLVDKNKFAFYASAGLNLNIIGDAQYDIIDAPVGRYPSSAAPTVKPDRSPEINQQARLSEKEFSRGVFHGGSLTDNLYATASLGIGLSRELSNVSTAYIEPTYSHFISPNGIGPNEDRLHSVAVNIGVRFLLN